MKKIFTLSSALMFALGSFAQYSLSYQANGLRKGDYRNLKEIQYVEQANAGSNQVWDFSNSKIVKSFYINQNEDLQAIANEGYRLSCDEGGTKNTLFEITPSEKRYFGLETNQTTLTLDEPIVDLFFPLSYQDTKVGPYSGTVQHTNSSSYFDGSYITKADAWGTVILPDGSVFKNVLRVKVEKNYTEDYSNYKFSVKSVRYQYFAEGARYPIIITVEEEHTPLSGCKCSNSKYTAMYMETPATYKNDAVVTNKKKSAKLDDFNYLVSPNPFAENINVAFSLSQNSNVVIEIHDMAGRKVLSLMNKNLESGKHSLDFATSSLFPGNYVLNITVNGKAYANKILKNEK